MPQEPVAFFKIRPSHPVLCRPGAVQCIRNCTHCVAKNNDHLDADLENIIAMKSYDDLLLRRKVWFSKFKSIIYHPGQVDLVKNTLRHANSRNVIYLVACQHLDDIRYLEMVMEHEMIPSSISIINPNETNNIVTDIKKYRNLIVPVDLRNILTQDHKTLENIHSPYQLYNLIRSISELSDDASEEISVVPIATSKDYDKISRFGSLFSFGTFCVQMLEPYLMREYTSHVHLDDPIEHFLKHIHHDLALNAARLPSHIIAFILLYLNRDEQGVDQSDLVDYLGWILKYSLEFNLHIAFTGKLDDIVSSAIFILEEHLHIDEKNKIYRPINCEALSQYASAIIPNFACYGIIARSILNVHNAEPKNPFRLCFDPSIEFRVMKDDVLDLSVSIAERLDEVIVYRRPCNSVSGTLLDIYSKMEAFGHYFVTVEPKVRRNTGKNWAGDCDSDEEYYWSKKEDPAFKAWTVLTRRPYRLDRLNLFMNAIDVYLS